MSGFLIPKPEELDLGLTTLGTGQGSFDIGEGSRRSAGRRLRSAGHRRAVGPRHAHILLRPRPPLPAKRRPRPLRSHRPLAHGPAQPHKTLALRVRFERVSSERVALAVALPPDKPGGGNGSARGRARARRPLRRRRHEQHPAPGTRRRRWRAARPGTVGLADGDVQCPRPAPDVRTSTSADRSTTASTSSDGWWPSAPTRSSGWPTSTWTRIAATPGSAGTGIVTTRDRTTCADPNRGAWECVPDFIASPQSDFHYLQPCTPPHFFHADHDNPCQVQGGQPKEPQWYNPKNDLRVHYLTRAVQQDPPPDGPDPCETTPPVGPVGPDWGSLGDWIRTARRRSKP